MKVSLYCPVCQELLTGFNGGYSCAKCGRFFPIIDGIPSLIVDSHIEEGFNPRFFEALVEIEKTHCWFVSRREMILDMLRRYLSPLRGKSILEVGCGHGSILQYLRTHAAIEAVGTDLFMQGLVLSRSKDIPLLQVDASHLPFREAFDAIGLFDVIEHVDDDAHVLRQCYRALKGGGKIFVTVPAFPSLWSVIDDIACHKRRYKRAELFRKIADADFIVEKCSYFMCSLLPIAYLMRRTGAKKGDARTDLVEQCACYFRIHPLINAVALWILRCENRLMRYLDFPWGLSLLAVARKETKNT